MHRIPGYCTAFLARFFSAHCHALFCISTTGERYEDKQDVRCRSALHKLNKFDQRTKEQHSGSARQNPQPVRRRRASLHTVGIDGGDVQQPSASTLQNPPSRASNARSRSTDDITQRPRRLSRSRTKGSGHGSFRGGSRRGTSFVDNGGAARGPSSSAGTAAQ